MAYSCEHRSGVCGVGTCNSRRYLPLSTTPSFVQQGGRAPHAWDYAAQVPAVRARDAPDARVTYSHSWNPCEIDSSSPACAFQDQGEHVSDAVDVLSSLHMCLYKILEGVGVSHNIPSNKPCGAAALRVLGARALPLADGPTAHALGLRHRSGGARLPDLLLAHCHKEWLASALHLN